jgi:hypothetical protein
MNVRAAEHSETGALARLWFDGWQDAHAEILPVDWLFIYCLFIARGRWAEALEGSRQDRPGEFGCLPGPDLM